MQNHPSNPVHVPHLIHKRFDFGHYSQCAARIGPDCIYIYIYIDMLDLTSRIWFGTILPKKAWIILCKTSPDPIWMAWSVFFPNTSGPGASQRARIIGPCSGRTQLPAITYQFPTFRLGCFLPQMAWVRLRNASLDLFWFWLSAFGQTDPVIKARWCARIIEPASGKHLGYGSDVNWIRHVYWEETSSVYGHIFWTPFCPRIFCD